MSPFYSIFMLRLCPSNATYKSKRVDDILIANIMNHHAIPNYLAEFTWLIYIFLRCRYGSNFQVSMGQHW